VVFAREGSAAGKVWNQQSMEFMQNFIQSKGAIKDSILEASILGRLMNFTMETLPRYFTNLKKSDFFPTKTSNASRALFLLHNKRFFVGPQFATELKRDAKIVEWEILYQSNESPYTLDYEILQKQSETIVRIELPGVFPDGKDTEVTKRTLRSRNIGPDDFFLVTRRASACEDYKSKGVPQRKSSWSGYHGLSQRRHQRYQHESNYGD
jgi:hypothetical protein